MIEFIKVVVIMVLIAVFSLLAYNASRDGFEAAQAAHDAKITLHKMEHPRNER